MRKPTRGIEFPPWPCVYAVSATYRLVKIGHSTHFAQRFADLQHASPHRLRVIGTLPGGVAEERVLHAMFKRFRRQGEWFDLPKPVRLRLEAIFAGEIELDPVKLAGERSRRLAASKPQRPHNSRVKVYLTPERQAAVDHVVATFAPAAARIVLNDKEAMRALEQSIKREQLR